jgi:hypothetical protein
VPHRLHAPACAPPHPHPDFDFDGFVDAVQAPTRVSENATSSQLRHMLLWQPSTGENFLERDGLPLGPSHVEAAALSRMGFAVPGTFYRCAHGCSLVAVFVLSDRVA